MPDAPVAEGNQNLRAPRQRVTGEFLVFRRPGFAVLAAEGSAPSHVFVHNLQERPLAVARRRRGRRLGAQGDLPMLGFKLLGDLFRFLAGRRADSFSSPVSHVVQGFPI